MTEPFLILICDDDRMFHAAVKHSLKEKYDLRSAYNTEEAIAILKKHAIDVILLDVQMRTPDEGLRAIPVLREMDPELAIIMTSGLTDFQTVKEAMRLGASDYVPKDFNPDDLAHTIECVLEKRSLIQRKHQQDFEAVTYQRQHVMVGESAAIKSLRKTIERIRQSPANVVITGETGTGKEVVARQLRRTLSNGSLEPFVAIDSATIQSSTAESILFGHEKGAFTGADKTTKGIFEEANGGVVYFDEIGNMPLDIQAKCLRVLQEKEVARLGSSRTIKLDFRVISATNKNLEEMIGGWQFKDDLYQRLNVLPLHIPPLRERTDDIALLVKHFLSQQPYSSGNLTFTDAALEALKAYSWPGNVRELGNMISYVVAMTEGTEVDVADLPPKLREAARAKPKDAGQELQAADFYSRIAEYEKRLLDEEYGRHGGNISKLAIALGMDRSHLYTKLREHGVHVAKQDPK